MENIKNDSLFGYYIIKYIKKSEEKWEGFELLFEMLEEKWDKWCYLWNFVV